MTSGKKKRMSMLDNLAAAGGPAPAPQAGAVTPMMTSNRALRSARDAVDSHHVWELDPASIVDDRMADRLDPPIFPPVDLFAGNYPDRFGSC